MRKLVAGLATLLLSSSLALADDIMTPRFGNTLVVSEANGSQTKLYFKADGTFTIKRNAETSTGTWKLDGAQLCINYAPAVEGVPPSGSCTPAAAHKVGDTWGSTGRTISLVQGIQ